AQGVPALPRAPRPVRARVQARGRPHRGRLRRREPTARAGPVTARGAESARRRWPHPARGAHRRHAQGRGAHARRLARPDRARQGGGPGGPRRGPGGGHRGDPAHRLGDDSRTDDPTRFLEENVGTLRLALVALIALLACGKREEGRGKGVVDVLLRGGWIIDGSGNPRYQGDVAITGDRIAGVGFLNGAAARETVDVSGLAVAPKETGAPTGPELARMTALVDTLMEQGALGLWTALEYAPASYSATDEIIALAKAARRHGGIYASHMRNEGIRIDDALNELFQIARQADIPAEVSHLKVSGRKSWGQMARILARIDSARAAGLDVTADQYPYTRAATALDASIPSWAESGGWDSLLARLRDPATRSRLRDEMLNPRGAESF